MCVEYEKMKHSMEPTCQTCGNLINFSEIDLGTNCIHFANIVTEANAKWTNSAFPWDQKIIEINRLIFGNEDFRPNQKRVINAALSG